MAEFVTHGTNASYLVAAVQFTATGIGVYQQSFTDTNHSGAAGLQIPSMGPDGCAGTTVSFTITGIDDIYLVNKSVVIPVVLLPVVNAVFHYFNGLMNHFARMLVVSLRIIAAIVAVLLRYGDGTHDVERQFKLAFALGVEIIIH